MGDHEDRHWVALARNGDQEAFRRLVDAHARSLFKLCVRITQDVTLAEDAVQEAFYQAWRSLSSFEQRAAFSTWLHRIAVNAALQVMRRSARHDREVTAVGEIGESDLLESLEDEQPGLDAQAEAAQVAEHIGKHLGLLSAMERAAFVMRHYEGESLDVISATLGMKEGQCKQAIFRAVSKLRRALADWR